MPVNVFLPQVTRIPIKGPGPFNTLVCVQAQSEGGPQQVTVGKLYRNEIWIPTLFKLAGFDQRVPPVFEHSTTAWLSSIGPMNNGNWLHAVDAVTDAAFDPLTGQFFVKVKSAILPTKEVNSECFPFIGPYPICFYHAKFQISSFILCTEPPLKERPGHLSSFSKPAMIVAMSSVNMSMVAKAFGASFSSKESGDKNCTCTR